MLYFYCMKDEDAYEVDEQGDRRSKGRYRNANVSLDDIIAFNSH